MMHAFHSSAEQNEQHNQGEKDHPLFPAVKADK